MIKKRIDFSSLWKKEDWLSVWIGFFILIIFMAGFTINLPKWKWATDSEFNSKIPSWVKKVESLTKEAADKDEKALQKSALSLKLALDVKDRKAIGNAASEVEKIAKEANNNELKNKGEKLGKEIKDYANGTIKNVLSGNNLKNALYIFIGFYILGAVGMLLMGGSIKNFTFGFTIVFFLAALAFFIAGNSTVSYYGLEVVFWALLIGLVISNTIGVPEWLRTAVKTEFFIKIGLVLLGAEILLGTIAKVGAYGIIQSILVISTVFYVCFWVARKLGLDDEFASILATGVSVCGVSAAIAAGGAVKGDPKKVSHTISLILLFAIPMLILEPIIAKAANMLPAVAGAWIGGTIDTTGAVVAAGAMIDETAMSIAVIIKMAQNVFIGVIAFILAVWFSFKNREIGKKPSFSEIWIRFPKFVLGFLIASFVFSFFIPESEAKAITNITKSIRSWWFTLAFLCIGLETKFKELFAMGGGKPAIAFITAQAFNILWTLLLAYIIFGGLLWPAPTF